MDGLSLYIMSRLGLRTKRYSALITFKHIIFQQCILVKTVCKHQKLV